MRGDWGFLFIVTALGLAAVFLLGFLFSAILGPVPEGCNVILVGKMPIVTCEDQ